MNVGKRFLMVRNINNKYDWCNLEEQPYPLRGNIRQRGFWLLLLNHTILLLQEWHILPKGASSVFIYHILSLCSQSSFNEIHVAHTCINVHTLYKQYIGPAPNPPLCLPSHPRCLLLSPTRSFIILSEQRCQQPRLNGLFQDPFGSISIKDPTTLMGDSSRRRREGYVSKEAPWWSDLARGEF